MKIRLLLLSLSLSLLALGAGAAPAYMDAKSSFPATPQGEAPLQQTYLQSSQDEAFLRLVKARNSKTLTPDLQTELLGELQNYQLADYAYAWNLLDAAKDAPDDPVLMEQAYEFLRTHQGEYIAERLGTDLARISRTCFMNVSHLKEIKQIMNSHLEAVLDNDEKLIVSRKYLQEIKKIFRRKLL